MPGSNSKRKTEGEEEEEAQTSKIQKTTADSLPPTTEERPSSFEESVDDAWTGLIPPFHEKSVADYYASYSEAVSAALSVNSRDGAWFPKPVSAVIVSYAQTTRTGLEGVLTERQRLYAGAVSWYFQYLATVPILSVDHVEDLPHMRSFLVTSTTLSDDLKDVTNSLVERPQVKSPAECTLVVEVLRLVNNNAVACQRLYEWLLRTNSYVAVNRISLDVLSNTDPVVALIVDPRTVADCLSTHGIGIAALVRLYSIAQACRFSQACEDWVYEYIGVRFNLDEFLKTAVEEGLHDVLCFIILNVSDDGLLAQLATRIEGLTINTQNVEFWEEVSVVLPVATTLCRKLSDYYASIQEQ